MQKRSSKKSRSKDENILAKSVIDDIIEETESDEWEKEPPKKNPATVIATNIPCNKNMDKN